MARPWKDPLILVAVVAGAVLTGACGGSSTSTSTSTSPDPAPAGTVIVRETLADGIGATTSPTCSAAFVASVHPTYYLGGTQRCVEYRRRSLRPGMVIGDLRWQDSRIDLDLVLNDGVGSNFRQSIAANRCCEKVEFFVNAGTDYIFVVYLRGVDPQFLANGGIFSGPVSTAFTLAVEHPD